MNYTQFIQSEYLLIPAGVQGNLVAPHRIKMAGFKVLIYHHMLFVCILRIVKNLT